MKNLMRKIIRERWHLHIAGGAVAGLLLFGLFCLLGFYNSTRWWEETILQLVFGTVAGLVFEIGQDHTSAVYYRKVDLLYRIGIFSRSKVVGSKADALATGVGFALIVPLIYLFL
jgi:hypothetical protein